MEVFPPPDGLDGRPGASYGPSRRQLTWGGVAVSRPAVVAALVASLCVPGCHSQPMLPAGEDREELVATIARRGQGDATGEPDPSALGYAFAPDRCLESCGSAVLVCAGL